jgi:hypothetical protein
VIIFLVVIINLHLFPMHCVRKECYGLNLKKHARSTERFFGRTGIFKYGFDCGFTCTRHFTLEKPNIYEERNVHQLHRIQLKWNAGYVRVAARDFEYVPEAREEDIDNVPFTFDCWQAHSEFVVYFEMYPSPRFYIEKIVGINPSDEESFYPDDRCSFERPSGVLFGTTQYYHLILPWFDRTDRTRFWSMICAKKFHSGPRATVCPYLELAIFILEYL